MFKKRIKNIFIFAASLLILLFAIALCHTFYNEHKYGKPVTSWMEYNYNFWELRKLKKAVQNGDVEAAYNLGMYYSRIENDYKKAEKYFYIAAEGNHAQALRELENCRSLIGAEE